MINERLRAAVAAAEQLPDDMQVELAEILEAEMEWDLALANPANTQAIESWMKEVDQAIDAGEVYDWPGPDDKSGQ